MGLRIRARKKAVRKARDPDRRRKIAEAKRGKPLPRHVIEAMRKGRLGNPHPPEVRARLSPFLRERAKVFVPNGWRWEPWEDDLVGPYRPRRPPGRPAGGSGRSTTCGGR